MTSLSTMTASARKGADFMNFPVPVGPINEMVYSASSTYFTLWAPSAVSVRLTIYPTGDGGVADASYDMNKSIAGKWTLSLKGDFEGKFYTFRVKVQGGWLDETPGIFCKATGVNGRRAAIIDMKTTNPEGWGEDRRPELKDFSDIVLYEMHHRDFSMDRESGIKHKGKFLALTENGTKNANGHSTGLDHLKQLGITHVHLLPSFDFGSIDEKHPEHSYNWGYDPVNYNVPEGSYSTDPYTPATRIREFKQMVMALHRAGIRVVLDVVYNHVFDAASSQFERTVPGYFFRHNADGSLSNASGCGNETASEMPMVRKFMVESVLYWLNEYHVDGFRFDLMGIHDIETMNAIREAVNAVDPSVFIYGEGWAASSPALPEARLAMKGHIGELNEIAAFGDEFRDGLRGSWTDDTEGAFLLNRHGHDESVKFGIVGAIKHPQVDYSRVNYSKNPWANEPTQMISYVSCHDDLCLSDRLMTTLAYRANSKGAAVVSDNLSAVSDETSAVSANLSPVSTDEHLRLQKLAETAVLTSQGVPLIWCGDEILRDKKGVRNSYNSPDSVNSIPWAHKTAHKDLFDYISHLINIRKSHKAFHMGSAKLVQQNLHFLPSPKNVIAFELHGTAVGDSWGRIVVVLNGKTTSTKVAVPQGTYTVVCRNGEINPEGLAKINCKSVSISPQSALIMYR